MGRQKKTNTTSDRPKKHCSADTAPSHPSPRLRLVSDEHPDQQHKLFSNSTEAAKEEGRVKKVAKMPKNALNALIAKAVFTVDADSVVRDDYAVNPADMLHKQYHEANAKIRHTGAGLEYSPVTEGSDVWNIIRASNHIILDVAFGYSGDLECEKSLDSARHIDYGLVRPLHAELESGRLAEQIITTVFIPKCPIIDRLLPKF
ncbi:hypothetical protein C8J56DRAFT_1025941 [Mycena floridula]|nr:hypothetical protein C8J56DRAFT_1025941 [Mycena floridula]